MIALTIDKTDSFVAKMQRKGVKVRWDGWNMVFFKADRGAIRSAKGRRLGSEWGFETIVGPSKEGLWMINYSLTRGAHG